MSEVANKFVITGQLFKVFPTERKSDKFQCREFVIEIAGQYPEFIKFQLTQDRCDLIDSYTEGVDEIEVSFNVTGREWQGKYFTTLNAWKIKKIVSANITEEVAAEIAEVQVIVAKQMPFPPPISEARKEVVALVPQADNDDLPF